MSCCHVATVAPFMSYDVAIMELFRGMTKRKNVDQMNHLLQDVGRANDNDFILNVRNSG